MIYITDNCALVLQGLAGTFLNVWPENMITIIQVIDGCGYLIDPLQEGKIMKQSDCLFFYTLLFTSTI